MIFRTPGSGLSAQLEVGTIWTGLPSWSTISSEGHPTEQLSQEHKLTEYLVDWHSAHFSAGHWCSILA